MKQPNKKHLEGEDILLFPPELRERLLGLRKDRQSFLPIADPDPRVSLTSMSYGNPTSTSFGSLSLGNLLQPNPVNSPHLNDVRLNPGSEGEGSYQDGNIGGTPRSPRANANPINRLISDMSGHWEKSAGATHVTRTSLAILQGLAERISRLSHVAPEIFDFFRKHFALIQHERSDPKAIERDAAELGLPVMESEDIVTKVEAKFGLIEELIEASTDDKKASVDKKARVILYYEDGSIVDDIMVPLSWIPKNYREEGAGIAWVERGYECGVKGRFEPGSSRNGNEDITHSITTSRPG